MIWYAMSAGISPAGSSRRGIVPSPPKSGSTESSVEETGWEGCLRVTVLLCWGRCDATPADERSTFSRRTMGLFDRLRRGHAPTAEPKPETPERTVVEIDASSLSRVFSAPMWLRDLGLLAWFLVGVGILFVGLVWLLGLTSTITMPVIVGAILATVAGPLVTRMQKHMPRAAGAAIVLLGLLVLAFVIALMVFGGIFEQSSEIKSSLSQAVDKIQGWFNDLGSGGTSGATQNTKSGTSDAGGTLLKGLAQGIQGLTSLIFFLTFTVFATFFLL